MKDSILDMTPAELYWQQRARVAESRLEYYINKEKNKFASPLLDDAPVIVRNESFTETLLHRHTVGTIDSTSHGFHCYIKSRDGKKIAYYISGDKLSVERKSDVFKKILEDQINQVSFLYGLWRNER